MSWQVSSWELLSIVNDDCVRYVKLTYYVFLGKNLYLQDSDFDEWFDFYPFGEIVNDN